MNQSGADRPPGRLAHLYVWALSALLCAGWFAAEGRIGIDLGDEGFLWYGASRVLQGEVPIRDFDAYDPARYYWTAAWLALLGGGPLAVRVAQSVIAALGLGLGLLVARRLTTSRPALAIIGLALSLWLFPRHKLFEPAIALSGVYVLLRLLEEPRRRTVLLTGFYVGFAGVIGKNHGAYALVAAAIVLAVLVKQGRLSLPRIAAPFGAAVIVGYAPMLMAMLLVPGFFAEFTALAATILDRGAGNLALPVPWPWKHGLETTALPAVRQLGVGSVFVLALAIPVSAVVALVLGRKADRSARRVLLASVAVAIPYLHHGFSRADLPHLAQIIHPLWLATGALLAVLLPRLPALIIWTGVMLASGVVAVGPDRPLGRFLRDPAAFVSCRVAGDRLLIERGAAEHLGGIGRWLATEVGPARSVLFAPLSPGLYAAFDRRSPTQELYMLIPRARAQQERVIAELGRARVSWALLTDVPVDGRDDLRMRNAQPLVWHYLYSRFHETTRPWLSPEEHLLTADDGVETSATPRVSVGSAQR